MKTEHNLLVKPINEEKVMDLLVKAYPPAEDEQYKITGGALVGSNVIVDEDCCYFLLDSYLVENEIAPMIMLPVRIKKKTATGWTLPFIPTFFYPVATSKFADIMGPEVTLKDFMGGRYNYNPRISRNMRQFLKDIGSQLEAAEHGK